MRGMISTRLHLFHVQLWGKITIRVDYQPLVLFPHLSYDIKYPKYHKFVVEIVVEHDFG